MHITMSPHRGEDACTYCMGYDLYLTVLSLVSEEAIMPGNIKLVCPCTTQTMECTLALCSLCQEADALRCTGDIARCEADTALAISLETDINSFFILHALVKMFVKSEYMWFMSQIWLTDIWKLNLEPHSLKGLPINWAPASLQWLFKTSKECSEDDNAILISSLGGPSD